MCFFELIISTPMNAALRPSTSRPRQSARPCWEPRQLRQRRTARRCSSPVCFERSAPSRHYRLVLVGQVDLEHLAERRLVLGLVRPGQRPERQLTEANTNIWHVIEVYSHVAPPLRERLRNASQLGPRHVAGIHPL